MKPLQYRAAGQFEPKEEELESLVRDEERELLDDPGVPDEVKSEIEERLERFEERDLELERAEDAGNERNK